MSEDAFVVRGAKVFDGERFSAPADVSVRNGVVAEDPPEADAVVVDGTGCTLMPGLIDSHVHAWGPLERTLGRYLLFGVTTALEMECDGDGLAELHEIRKLDPPHCAQLFSSGFPVTVPGGHGTEYGFAVPTVSSAADMDAFVAARCEEGSDFIKIIYNDRSHSSQTLTVDMVRAAAASARARGKLSIAHISTLRTATEAIECGVGGLAHAFLDPDVPDFARLAADRGIFVVPTLALLASAMSAAAGGSILEDERLAPFFTSFDRIQLSDDGPTSRKRTGRPLRTPPVDWRFDNAPETVRRLADAGVPLLAGTDAPNSGTTHGASIHHELSLLVEAGLTATQALAAATSVPATCFALPDRGRIAPGLRADLLLVGGDAERDITVTRDIVGVWKAGARLERVPRTAA